MVAEIQQVMFTSREDKAAKDVTWLEGLLRVRAEWLTSNDLLALIGWPATEANKRWLRGLASSSKVILSGQLGYKHAGNATAEEVNHSANWLISQGKEMIKRGLAQRRAAHGILG